MTVQVIDPERDPRWSSFVSRHPRASVFHLPAWLRALRETYAYTPLAFTTTPAAASELTCGVVGCDVRSWFGRRFVSLPFSDHCEPLVDERPDMEPILEFLQARIDARSWRRAELRPLLTEASLGGATGTFAAAQRYWIHHLDLTPTLDELHSALHRSCMQRAIKRAGREALTYVSGPADSLVSTFYPLFRMTRRRHGLPPQPLAWFRHLAASLGDAARIGVALKDGRPIAGVLTLFFRNTAVYKYGCSDARFHGLGAMPFLLWHTIRDAKERGYVELDLGRSDLDQGGLVAFKDRLGARRSELIYYRYPASPGRTWPYLRPSSISKTVISRMPAAALTLAGRVFYRHVG